MSCQEIEEELASLNSRRVTIEARKAEELSKAAPGEKVEIIARYTEILEPINAAIKKAHNDLADCRSVQDVAVTGTVTKGMEPFDRAVQKFMWANGVQAGQLTILRHGMVLLERAYTCGGPAPTRTDSLFRIASCSKAFTCAAIGQLYDDKTLSPDAQVFPLLGIDTPAVGPRLDPRLDTVTVDQCVNGRGGWDKDISGFDPVFRIRDIAQALDRTDPPTKLQIAAYMYGQMLQREPGLAYAYSNFAYLLLGLVVERVTGMPYIDYLRGKVLAPLRLDDVFVAPMMSGPPDPREVVYDAPGLGPDALHPALATVAPLAYGGEGFVTERMDSGGGLMTTASTLARFVHVRAAWDLGGRAPGTARSGGMAGTSSRITSRATHDVDYAWIFNTRSFQEPGDPLGTFTKAFDSIFDSVPLPDPIIVTPPPLAQAQ